MTRVGIARKLDPLLFLRVRFMTPSEQIAQALTDPQSISGDGVTVQARSIDDLLKGLNYAAMLATLNKRRRGIRYSQLLPQGPLDDCGRSQSVCCFNRGFF